MTYLYQDYLAHHGVKGQKWGVRRYQDEDGTYTKQGMKRLQKDAKKDAERYARAQAYYGEGAGNRRKAIKNELSEKMKDPKYKEEFDKWLSVQDMSKHQKAATRERHTRDTATATKKTARKASIFLLSNGPTLVRVARAMTGMI